MKIKIVFHGSLKQYNNNIAEIEKEIPKEITVDQLIAKTEIPTDEIAFVAVNGSRAPGSLELQEGDEVKLFQMVGGG
ncbi:MAG: MoaD/ThiS family protein [bacterium]|nr:MAG: MoaD/ThiS family protein [bacterium]